MRPRSPPRRSGSPTGSRSRIASGPDIRAAIPPRVMPDARGLAYEETTVQSGRARAARLVHPRPGRRSRARRRPGPRLGVGARPDPADGPVPQRRGFHCLTFDVRGHGANPAEDAAAERRRVRARRGCGVRRAPRAARGHRRRPSPATRWARSGRSWRLPPIPASRSSSRPRRPADPYRLTRQTFRLAHLPIPDPIAYPLAWLTTRVYLRPRGHRVDDISASTAIARYDGPILLAHGSDDAVVPPAHMARLAAAARAGRSTRGTGPGAPVAPIETLLVPGRPAFVAVRVPGLPAAWSRRSQPGRWAGR